MPKGPADRAGRLEAQIRANSATVSEGEDLEGDGAEDRRLPKEIESSRLAGPASVPPQEGQSLLSLRPRWSPGNSRKGRHPRGRRMHRDISGTLHRPGKSRGLLVEAKSEAQSQRKEPSLRAGTTCLAPGSELRQQCMEGRRGAPLPDVGHKLRGRCGSPDAPG